MPIETDCPGCERRLRVGDEYAGRQARCPVCAHVYTVPQPTPEAVGASLSSSAGRSPESSSYYGPPSSPSAPAAPSYTPTASSYTPAADNSNWWLRTPDGRSYGPIGKTEMDRWVAEGRVTSECLLRYGERAWEPADRQYPGLREKSRGVSIQPYGGATWSPPIQPIYAPAGHRVRSPHEAPHRGAVILVLGLLAVVMGCPILSIMAWVMGSADIRAINAGRMDREGYSLTYAGYMIGMIYSLITIAIWLLILPFFLLVAVAGAVN